MMITKINTDYLIKSFKECVDAGLCLGKLKQASRPFYPTPSGMNIKVPEDIFLKTSHNARIRYHKDNDCYTVFHSIPDDYVKDCGIGFEGEIKEDIMQVLPLNRLNRLRASKISRVKIGELITPPHFYKKEPKLEPHYYINELWSTGKNTGTNAIKEVVMKSLNDPETQGRVLVDACCIDGKTCPVGFYYKLGFRSIDSCINEICENWLKRGGKIENAPKLPDTEMYLPKENIEHCLNYGLDIKV